MSFPFDHALAAQLKKAKPEVLREIVRQAELRLQHSCSSTLHRDVRNLTTALAFAAFSAAGFTAAAAGLGGGTVNLALAWMGGSLGVGMLLAAVIALWMARPRGYYTPGNIPTMWLDDIAAGASMDDALADTATIYQACIDSNEALAKEQQSGLMNAWFVAVTSIVVALCSGAIAAFA